MGLPMIPIPPKAYLIGGAAAGIAVTAFWIGWEWRDRSADAELSAANQAHSEAVAAAEAENARLQAQYRDRERQLQDQITGVSDDLTRQLLDTEAQYTAALAAANTDAGRLRIEVARCRAASVPSAPNTADTASGDDDSAPERVIPDTSATLDILRIARDADRVAARLSACQAYVQQVRAEF